ncbi:hypothetical protein QTP70_004749 [Hemibagrus guttatus]|uniref:ribonuclease H n=1 Tax=Hemibagrus guttatus TaxID=175788 RepID=A0AAE0V4F6_9TELE|nr:hypothetical protein QTP70_004749 [Hemibagrus guttatus]
MIDAIPVVFAREKFQDQSASRSRKVHLHFGAGPDLYKILSDTPPVWKGSSRLFRNLNEKGIISYTEYLFLLCILTKPQAGFKIAFNMFDADGNEMVDKREFMVLEEIFRKKNDKRGGETDSSSQVHVQVNIADTTLLVHFFGKKGKTELNFEDFYRFMDNLQTEVLEIEFLAYSKGMTTISEEDFARILLQYTTVDNISSYLENVHQSIPDEKGITFEEFRSFFQFLNNLEDFAIAMQMYNYASRPIGQDEFARAVYVATGLKLSKHLVNIVFKIFDVDHDDQLSYKEFIGIMKDRLHRGSWVNGTRGTHEEQSKSRGLCAVVINPRRLKVTNFIPDRSRPGLTTTAIGAVDLQGAGGNWATVGRRSRGGRRVRRQREKRKGKSVGLRIGTLNVGTMTGKGRELADMMERRKVDILCVQETRWKGSKARSIGAGFKLFYYGVDSKRNGVGVVLKEEFVRNVLEVKRVSDRVMSLKLEIEGVMLNVVSGYAPQVGCELEEKERFWSELDEVMESIPTGERVVIGADFNGHVGEGNTGDEEVMGKFGVKERNLEGQMVVDFAKRMDMGVVNTYFQKREEHRVTYKSGGRRTQVDYILCRRGNLKEISDCKVVVGESVARQHRMVVCRMTLMVCKTKRSKIEKKTKWWKLKKEECCEEFRQKLRQALGGQVVLPDDWETTAEVIRETGRKVLGVSSGRRKEDKETWWWNEEVQDSIQRKRLAKKKWDMDRTEENRQEYKELQRRVKREVSKAKQKAYEELYTRLDTREGEKDLYRLARQRDRDGKDMQQVRVIKDRDGRVLTSEESVQRRWKEYFEELMNEENEREKRVEGVNSVEQKVDKIRKDEVRKALKRMKSGKAVGPDDIPVEVWKCLGEAAVEFLANLFNRVLESERMPEEWRRSVLVPIFKNKGDVQSCSNYRGIKLMSHTMKVWERVVEARLRKVVEICEQQYGFMPRKSTTDAIFALRILMEKYRDGQRELHCVFVDLEKAYDRVPREELWYCMRKSGVAEKYVRVVQDMYERSRTVVRCAVGQTEEFNVEVGLHQGSALSPFLFAMVMDQLSEEVRQESPWTMMFADDIVICSESREQVEENLERWRFALERRGMKVSRSKTEYMCVNEREGSGTVRLQGEEVKKVQEFKYLGSTVQSNGECGKEVKKRVQAGWNGWRKVSGVLCDQKISARIKGKVYRTVVRAAMLYGLETVSLRKRQESELEVAELKMLRFSLGVTRLDRIRNEYIRGTAHFHLSHTDKELLKQEDRAESQQEILGRIAKDLPISTRTTSGEVFRAPAFLHGADKNGFSLGVSKNFRQVFGDEKKYWLLPVFSSDGETHQFPSKPLRESQSRLLSNGQTWTENDETEEQDREEVKMGRGSPIPPMLRRKIEEQYQKGVSQRKIAKSLKLSSSTVHNIIQRFRESGTISVRKGQGRKTILDARDLRALRRHCITYRNATVMEITTWAQEYFQKTLSVNTIHRAIRRCRLKLYRSKKKPYLNMIQKRRHFLWAKAHLKWTVAKWKTVLWSDESKFEVLFGKLGRHVIRTKEDKDNPSCYQRSVQKPASLMVWGCMSACGMGSLHIWKGTINAERHKQPGHDCRERNIVWSHC